MRSLVRRDRADQRADQGEDPVRDLGGQGDQGGGADHAVYGHDRVEHALQVGVGAADHPAEHVTGAGDGVDLEHLGDRGEPFRDGIVAAGLADLERAGPRRQGWPLTVIS